MARVQADLDVVSRNLAATYVEDNDRSVRLYEVWRAPGRSGAATLPSLTVLMAFAGGCPADRVRERRQPAAGARR